MTMKLSYSSASPFVRKVRAAAIELGLEGRIEHVPTAVVPGRKNETYASQVNPIRKVPALQLEDGQVIVDSTTICEYLDALAGGGRLIPADGPARWRVLSQHAIAQGMIDALLLARYETALRPEALRWQTWRDDQWDKAITGLGWFETRAPDILPAAPTAIDLSHIALACVLGYLDFRFGDYAWRAQFPLLAQWSRAVSTRRSLSETVPVDPPPA